MSTGRPRPTKFAMTCVHTDPSAGCMHRLKSWDMAHDATDMTPERRNGRAHNVTAAAQHNAPRATTRSTVQAQNSSIAERERTRSQKRSFEDSGTVHPAAGACSDANLRGQDRPTVRGEAHPHGIVVAHHEFTTPCLDQLGVRRRQQCRHIGKIQSKVQALRSLRHRKHKLRVGQVDLSGAGAV